MTKDTARTAIHIRVSDDLLTLIDQVRIAEKHSSRADLTRTALRQFLDNQGDQVGSRRHFTKSMDKRMDRLERMMMQMQTNQSALMILVAQLNTDILAATGKENLNPADYVQDAFNVAQEQHDNIQNRSSQVLVTLIQKSQQAKKNPPPKPEE